MSFVSKLAMAAALAVGAVAMGASPAYAQKKEEKKDPQLKVSPEFRTAAAAAEAQVKAKDWANAAPSIAAAEAVAKNDDEKYFAAWLRFQLEANRGNEAEELKALQILTHNPRTPAEHLPLYNQRYNYLLGVAAAREKKYPEAIQYLTRARELGDKNTDIAVLLANAYSATNKPAQAIAEVDQAIQGSKAAGRKPPEDWYRFAIPRVNATGDRSAMASWLTRFIQEYPTTKNWRWAIVVFRNGVPAGSERIEKTAKIDLFRLMRATRSLADRGDYVDYADATQSRGLPWEAVSVIEEGKRTGKIPAADSTAQRILAASQAAVKSEGSLDSLATKAAAGKDGSTAEQAADALLASGNYARALELYDAALAKGGVDASQINLHRGIALHHLGRKEDARAAFKAVTVEPFANLALLWQASLDFPPLA